MEKVLTDDPELEAIIKKRNARRFKNVAQKKLTEELYDKFAGENIDNRIREEMKKEVRSLQDKEMLRHPFKVESDYAGYLKSLELENQFLMRGDICYFFDDEKNRWQVKILKRLEPTVKGLEGHDEGIQYEVYIVDKHYPRDMERVLVLPGHLLKPSWGTRIKRQKRNVNYTEVTLPGDRRYDLP